MEWKFIIGEHQKNFFADDRGKFTNDKITNMCENLNIKILNKTTHSPWQARMVKARETIVANDFEEFHGFRSDSPLACCKQRVRYCIHLALNPTK